MSDTIKLAQNLLQQYLKSAGAGCRSLELSNRSKLITERKKEGGLSAIH